MMNCMKVEESVDDEDDGDDDEEHTSMPGSQQILDWSIVKVITMITEMKIGRGVVVPSHFFN